MQVAGIDLAWGSRARTGIATTDDDGRLLHSASVTTDGEIAQCLYGTDPSVIAIDAPIIVRNPAGMRECERALSADFRRFRAGTHPTNMSRDSMHPQPRALRLAQFHQWSTDADAKPSQGIPLALEVYPHSSMVGLFGLDRVLEYKHKSGRTPESRRAEFSRLMNLMELHCDEPLALRDNRRWQQLREIARGATRHSELNSIEDEIDAIFCAYIAWVFVTEPARLTAYGSAEAGVIVTFPPPNQQEPTPR